jgi:hypothetical protein
MTMTSRERSELAALCRKQERLAKTMVAERSAVLIADFEAKMATEYARSDDENWSEAMRLARAAVDGVNLAIAESLSALGIPHEFAPSASLGWERRGANVTASRRTELRKVAETRIKAMERSARTEIERASLETQTALLAGGLESDEARRFLESMPSAESLMPALSVGEIETQLGTGGR